MCQVRVFIFLCLFFSSFFDALLIRKKPTSWASLKTHRAVDWLRPAQYYVFSRVFFTRCWSCINQQTESLIFLFFFRSRDMTNIKILKNTKVAIIFVKQKKKKKQAFRLCAHAVQIRRWNFRSKFTKLRGASQFFGSVFSGVFWGGGGRPLQHVVSRRCEYSSVPRRLRLSSLAMRFNCPW